MKLTYKTAPKIATNIIRFHVGEHLWKRMTDESKNDHVARALSQLWDQIEARNRNTQP